MSGEYFKSWMKCLSIKNVHEDWHFDIIQSQFISGEACKAHCDFISSDWVPEATLEEREEIVKAAARILVDHGYYPKISPLWFPNAYSEFTRWISKKDT